MSAVLGLMLLTVLTVAGLADATIGNDAFARGPEGTGSVPSSVTAGDPIIDARADPVRTGRLPDRTVALTFDDGPDPTWTPEVLAVLARHRVPGTFFVVGSMVSRHPDVTRRITASGSELGVHSFTHPDLARVSPWRLDREVAETQLAIAGAAGVSTHLLRPPFSSTPDALDDPGYATVVTAGRDGYVTVLTDVDGEDWRRPGVDAIVRNATPQNGAGATVLLHDAGGERSQTVAALDRLIPALQAQGYRFTTVSEAVGLGPHNTAASARDRVVGQAMLGAVSVAAGVVRVLHGALVVVGVLVVGRLLVMLVVARGHARRRRDPGFTWGEPVTETVSVVVPAYNEADNIEATVRSILANGHPLEVVVVDDGSTDGTADLVEELALPRVRVIRQVNAGKSAALNRGVAAARHDLVVMIDGDTIFQPDTVAALVAPFADPGVGAVAGNVKIADRDRLIPRLQHIEYVVGFNVDRRVQDRWGSISTIPGAAGAFRREAVREVGGLSSDTLAEDTDLTIALGRAGWRVVYADRALAWTEAPVTLGQLWRQRFRWSYGTMQALWKHRRALRESGASGRMGRVGLAHIGLFHVGLPLAAPLIDLLFVYGLVFGDPVVAAALWGSMLLLQFVAAAMAFGMDGEPKGPLWALPIQQVMYRQLMYVVLVQAVVSAMTGAGVRWQKLRRVGAVAEHLAAPSGADGRSRPAADRLPPPTVARGPAPDAAPSRRAVADLGGGRERWPDLLRAVALTGVVVGHAFGGSTLIPAAGILFALGGSLMVQSLRRREALDVLGHRLRRVLPPLWLFGLVAVPVVLWSGLLTPAPTASALSSWILPLIDTPGVDGSTGVGAGLWFLRAYLWFVLLTPPLLWAFRRRPLIALALPIAVVTADTLLGSPLRGGGAAGSIVLDAATFGACWLLGFAHREGMLRRLPGLMTGSLVVVLVAGGLAWALGHATGDVGPDLAGGPLAQALVSAGVVLVLLRVTPRAAWLERVPPLGRLVTVINARALTIFLWHTLALALAAPVAARLVGDSGAGRLGVAVGLIVVGVLAFGWVEDLAAGRPVSLLPDGRGTTRARTAPDGPRPPVIPNDVEAGITSALSQGSLRTRLTRLAHRAVPAPAPPLPSPTPTPPRPVPARPVPAVARSRYGPADPGDPAPAVTSVVPASPSRASRPLLSFSSSPTADPGPEQRRAPDAPPARSRHRLDDLPGPLPARPGPSRHARRPDRGRPE